MNTNKQIIYKRLLRLFNKNPFPIAPSDRKSFLNFVYGQYQEQKRGYSPSKRIVITPRFIINAIADFFNISQQKATELLKTRSSSRKHPSKMVLSHLDTAPKPRSSIIYLITRKHKPFFKITQPNGDPLTPTTLARTKSRTSGFNVSYSPVRLQRSNEATQHAITSNGSPLVRDISSDRITAWRKLTPSKASSRAYFDKPVAKKLNFDSEAQEFSFTITKEQILKRIKAKRPVSQKQVMAGVSAKNIIEELGAKMDKEYKEKIEYHWAHRQAWSLNGAQSQENIDPMTAGANYYTLVKVEAPIRRMLLNGYLNQLHVHGTIVFNQENGLPSQVIYRFSKSPEAEEFIEVIIDPMDHRRPTMDEHELACKISAVALTTN